jgi:dihydrolipoamide dehydrogenase
VGRSETASLVVVGGGPGGYAAAFRAADLGLDVTLVDADERLGGVCLLRGCIPSKALLHAARLVHEARDAGALGLRFPGPEIDLDRLRSWTAEVVDRLASGVAQLAKRRGVRVLQARARFHDAQSLELDGDEAPARLAFDHAILATGSEPAAPGALRSDDPRVMDSTSALRLERVPETLLVVGGGYIGLEMGSVYAALGSKVTLVELTGGLLPGVDPDLVRPLERRLTESVVTIAKSTKVTSLEALDAGIRVRLEGAGVPPQPLYERVLVAVGRRPLSHGLGLEGAGVERDGRGFVRVDRQGRTSAERIFAIGDVSGEPMLAHKASRDGRVAAEAIAGEPAEKDQIAVPAVVFTDPEVAWSGLTETAAREAGRAVRVARFPWAASGRALTLGRSDGFTKLVFDPDTERLLGVGIVGPGAGELIAEGTLAVEMGAVARDVAETIHTHPTLSETVGEAAEAFFGQATHIHTGRR